MENLAYFITKNFAQDSEIQLLWTRNTACLKTYEIYAEILQENISISDDLKIQGRKSDDNIEIDVGRQVVRMGG